MKTLSKFPNKKLKNPPYPLNIMVEIQLYKWKNKKRGQIYESYSGLYHFKYNNFEGKETSIQLFNYQIKNILIIESGEYWNCYE